MKDDTYFVELKDMSDGCIYPIILNDEQIKLINFLIDNRINMSNCCLQVLKENNYNII